MATGGVQIVKPVEIEMQEASKTPLPENYDREFKETSFVNPLFKDNSNLSSNAEFSGFYQINDPYKDQPGNMSMGIPSQSGISSTGGRFSNPSMGIPTQGVAHDFPSPGRPPGSLLLLPYLTLLEYEDAVGDALKGTSWKYTETGIKKLVSHISIAGGDLFYKPSIDEINKMTKKQQDMEQTKAKDGSGRKLPFNIKLTQENGEDVKR